ncbi:hypothetical protein V9T40_004638 [Parthenolecanium corni]|uniref:Uncharacterized protein n=1 Tax=Parthenolecanium corni TaxID=536013 RepID=A0AAN9TEV6_9HEMI
MAGFARASNRISNRRSGARRGEARRRYATPVADPPIARKLLPIGSPPIASFSFFLSFFPSSPLPLCPRCPHDFLHFIADAIILRFRSAALRSPRLFAAVVYTRKTASRRV